MTMMFTFSRWVPPSAFVLVVLGGADMVMVFTQRNLVQAATARLQRLGVLAGLVKDPARGRCRDGAATVRRLATRSMIMRSRLSRAGGTAIDSSAGLLLLVVAPVLAVAGLIWHSHRSRSLLERWAERNGYRIIDADYRNFFRGPFFWTSGNGQTVYQVTVEVKGRVRRG
jgi:hypothetical protein